MRIPREVVLENALYAPGFPHNLRLHKGRNYVCTEKPARARASLGNKKTLITETTFCHVEENFGESIFVKF